MTTDYASALAFLVNNKTKQPVPRKKIANNTYVEKGGHLTERGDQIGEGEIGVVLHETAVVVYGPGYIRLNTGGWLTKTTRDRLDTFTPENVRLASDRNARWLLHYSRGEDNRPFTGNCLPYFDGITLHLDQESGHYLPTIEDDRRDTSAEDAHNAMVKRLIKGYVKRHKDHGTLDVIGQNEPGLVRTWGSCRLCYWTDVPPVKNSYVGSQVIPNIGDKMGDEQHLIDHMLEGIIPEELEKHALREAAGCSERAELWHGIGWQVHESLRKFLLQRLLVGAVSTTRGRRPVTI